MSGDENGPSPRECGTRAAENYLCTITSTNLDGLSVQLSMCLHTWQLAHLINSINLIQPGNDPMLALHRPMLLERLQLWY